MTEKAKGTLFEKKLHWTCPFCGGVNESNINLGVRDYEKRKNLKVDHKKLCQKCPEGEINWVVVEVDI